MSSTSYPKDAQDWQGRFIANMADSLSHREDIKLALWAPPGELPTAVENACTNADALWLKHLTEQGGMAHLLRKRKLLAATSALSLLVRLGRAYRRGAHDVAHVNWLQNALPLWGSRTPALITVLGTDFALLKLPGMKMILRAMLRQRRAILAPNASWMQHALQRAFGDVAEVRTIPFGVNAPLFAVQKTGFDSNERLWIAVTRLTQRKIGDLFTWGEGLFWEHRQLHLFGPMQEQVTLPAWVHYHGPTHPAELLNDWFPKACGLITLSRHDEGRPQVMLEAMAAGLPVLASDLPAHRDMVQHRQTGWLAKSPKDLAQGLAWLEQPIQNRLAAQAARQWVKEAVGTWDDCAGRYATAYQDLLRPQP